jgi:multidrug efflux system outer membrane protein
LRHLTLTELTNAEIQLAQTRDQMQNSAKQLELLPGRFIEGNLGLPVPAGLPSESLERRLYITAAFACGCGRRIIK